MSVLMQPWTLKVQLSYLETLNNSGRLFSPAAIIHICNIMTPRSKPWAHVELDPNIQRLPSTIILWSEPVLNTCRRLSYMLAEGFVWVCVQFVILILILPPGFFLYTLNFFS